MQVSFVGANAAFRAQLVAWLDDHEWKAQGILHESRKYHLTAFETDRKVIESIYAHLVKHREELPLLKEAIFPQEQGFDERYITGVDAVKFVRESERMPAQDRTINMLAREMANDSSWW
ncbi:MAG: hypothetical protein QM758_06305 [Armatimonas sp.]